MLISRVAVPEGVLAPVVVVISDTSVRVSWQVPIKPNGPITAYFLYVDGVIVDPHTTWPSSYVIDGLQPYTVYVIQVSLSLSVCLSECFYLSFSACLIFTKVMNVAYLRCRNKTR